VGLVGLEVGGDLGHGQGLDLPQAGEGVVAGLLQGQLYVGQGLGRWLGGLVRRLLVQAEVAVVFCVGEEQDVVSADLVAGG